MARPTREESLRKQTKATIIKALEQKNTCEKYLLDQVDEYMVYFDSLKAINEKLSKGFNIDLSKEKRQVTKEMRSILSFLGLQPKELNEMDTFEEL